ncbi:DUF6779 domain-containing protein, partial [Mycobacterium heidelbergense]
WLPPGAPGSHWAGGDSPGPADAGIRRARHSHPDEPLDGSRVEHELSQPYGEPGRRARSRHSAEYRDFGIGNYAATNEPPATPPPPQMAPPQPPAHAPRHGGTDPSAEAQQGTGEAPPSGGHSVADLLARLQVEPSGGGRRRRREG